MTGVDFDIRGINHIGGLLDRLPKGEQARALAQRLGAYNTKAHEGALSRLQAFPTNFSSMDEDALSDAYAFWNSELIRIIEVSGLLDGQRKLLELNAKKARASARSKIRATYETELAAANEEGKKITKPTAGEINDKAEESDGVMQADTDLVMLDVVLASVHAYREGCMVATTGLSREYSLRQALFNARLKA